MHIPIGGYANVVSQGGRRHLQSHLSIGDHGVVASTEVVFDSSLVRGVVN
jgi:hypothetical protein